MPQSKASVSRKPRKTSGGFVTLLEQRPLIEAVLQVVNLHEPVDPEQIYRPLDPFAVGGHVARLGEAGEAAAKILWRDIAGHGLRAPHILLWRVGVVGVLDRIVESLPHARREYSAAVDEALQTSGVELVAQPRLTLDRLQVNLQIRSLYGCQAVETMALALLLDSTARIDKSRTFGEALRRCAYPECGQFFLSYTTKSGGRPPAYHDSECKRLHNKVLRALREG